ncbi:hypothetical protein [Mycoplasma leachii]|uniref:hypothetical protein n=1 Tax=Mycoplasma leachii TaxID=2105 RepID=UPI003DA27E25
MSNYMIYDIQPVLTSSAKLVVQELNKNCSWIINNFENYTDISDELEDELEKLNSIFNQWKNLTNQLFNKDIFNNDNLNNLEQLFDEISIKLDVLSTSIFNIYDLAFFHSSLPELYIFNDNKKYGFSPNNWKISNELKHLVLSLTYLKSLPDIFKELIITLLN